MAQPTSDIYSVTTGSIKGGRGSPPTTPAWVPVAGGVTQLGYASGAHPTGLDATRLDAGPKGKAWNPTPGDDGPWGGRIHGWANHTSFCGFVFSETTQHLITYGGGHATPCVPAPLAFNLATLAWEWLTIPPPTDALSLGATNSLGAHPASVAALTEVYPALQYDPEWGEWKGDWSGWGAFARPGEIFPEPGHTDCSIVWVPGTFIGNTNGAVIPMNMASGRWDGGEKTISHYFDLDVGEMKWKRLANKRTNPSTGAGGAVYFGGSINKVFALNFGSTRTHTVMDVLDGTTKLWTAKVSTNGAPISAYTCGMAAHIPSGLLINIVQVRSDGAPYYPGVTQEFWAVDAASVISGTHTWYKLTVSATSWPLNESGYTDTIGWCFCPRNGCFYATDGRNGSTTLWKLSPPAGASNQAQHLGGTWTITTESISPPLVNRNSNGVPGDAGVYFIYNRLVWNELRGCLLWPEEYNNSKVQAIKPFGT